MGNDHLSDSFPRASLGSAWEADNWSLKSNCLVRDSWDSPDKWPAYAYMVNGITKGNQEVRANLICDALCEVELEILTASEGQDGYGFCWNRSESAPDCVQIWKIAEGIRTELASANITATTTRNKWTKLKGRIETLDYNNTDAGCRLSLYFDDETTAMLTYTDRLQPTPRGDGYAAVRAVNGQGTNVKVDSIVIRRLFSVEVPKSYEISAWSWDRLADHALIRLERGGNPQFPKETMLEYLAFAEQEVAMKCGQPWWLHRTYELSTSSMLNTLPTWIGRVKDAIISGSERQLRIIPRAQFNLKDPGRTSTGTPQQLVFMGMADDGAHEYAVYPTPSDTVAITLYVIARAGHIDDSARLPLVPPEHVETLIFGALRRAMRYDANRQVVQENEQMWSEGRAAILRDHKLKTADNAKMMGPSEWRGRGRKKQWWRDPRYGPRGY